MSVNFHVGQNVVCTDDTWDHAEFDNGYPTIVPSRVPMLREVLEIRAMKPHRGAVLLHFCEINHWWDSRSFRPVVTRPTDISVFTDLLKTTRVGIEA